MSYLAKEVLVEKNTESLYEIYSIETVKDIKGVSVQIPNLKSKVTIEQLEAQKVSFQKQIDEIDAMLAEIIKIKGK